MADKILELLQKVIENGSVLVLIISMFPLIELKGAIPIGTKLNLPLYSSAILAYIGSTMIFIPIFFLLLPLFNLLKKIKPVKRFIEKVEQVLHDKAKKLALNAEKKKGKTNDKSDESKIRLMLIKGLFIFVAVPFPVTGVWTGTAIAVFLGLKFREAFPAIVLGNLVSGSIITLLTYFFKDYVDIIIYALFAIAIVMLVIFLVKIIMAKPQKEESQGGEKSDE